MTSRIIFLFACLFVTLFCGVERPARAIGQRGVVWEDHADLQHAQKTLAEGSRGIRPPHFGSRISPNPTRPTLGMPFQRLNQIVASASNWVTRPTGLAAPDPYERASITSNTYYDWLLDHVFLLVPAQDYVGKFLITLQDYPPRQKAASFNMDEILSKVKEPSGGSPD